MKKIANSKKIVKISNKISKAVELEFEEILEHAEAVVKEFIPARNVKAALEGIEKAMENEGVEIYFDKTVSREALRKTASEEVSQEEIKEFVENIVKALVEEAEEILEDTDAVTDETVVTFEGEDLMEVESRFKSSLEKKLASKGIYCKLARNQKKKVSLKDKILAAKK